MRIVLSPNNIAFVSVLVLGLLCIVRLLAQPSIGTLTYQYEGHERVTASHPLLVETEAQRLTVELPLYLSALHPNTFFVKPDDCLEELHINGQAVMEPEVRFCDYSTLGRDINLKKYLRPGENTLLFVIKDDGGKGGVRLTPSRTDGILLTLNIILVLSAAVAALLLIVAVGKNEQKRMLLTLFVAGAALRFFYLLATHYRVRSHDIDDHIRYIQYVAEHFWMPPASEGFVFHHPPLYFFLGGILARLDQLVHRTNELLFFDLQAFSFLISLATLAAGIWICRKLFPKTGPYGALFFSIIVTSPVLVFLSARITNNALYTLLAFLSFGLLIQWWQSGRMKDWYLLLAVLSLAFVTRVSALVFFPVVFLLLPLRTKGGWFRKIGHLCAGACLVALLAGWFPATRFFLEQDPTNMIKLGNTTMHSGLLLPTRTSNLLTFNPVGFLTTPFNHPWEDAARRQYFPEYLFRSAFFGEFDFPDQFFNLAVLILLSATLLLPYAVYGFWKRGIGQWKKHLPVTLLLLLMSASQVWYRLFAPYSSNQDFRHSVPIILPIAFFLVAGIQDVPKPLSRFGKYLVTILATLCFSFLFLLYFFEK